MILKHYTALTADTNSSFVLLQHRNTAKIHTEPREIPNVTKIST